TEWRPSAVLQVGETTYYVNDLGVVLDPAAEAGGLPVINRPDFGQARAGQLAVGGDLLPMLLQVRSGFAAEFKVSLMSFQLDRWCGKGLAQRQLREQGLPVGAAPELTGRRRVDLFGRPAWCGSLPGGHRGLRRAHLRQHRRHSAASPVTATENSLLRVWGGS